MRISKFKKYIAWNIISVLGYIFTSITLFFLLMFSLVSSNLNMRSDLDYYFYDYLTNHIVIPYFTAYKFLLFIVVFLLILSKLEHHYYKERASFGLRLFENHEKIYSVVFFAGIILNFLPMYIFLIYLIDLSIRTLRNFMV